ncbi:endonuclease/exonuclease/phosphatase family protein [Rhodobacteraceae bacterium F11138]|nr:endonuclease/exonuclease/phosphatase family protein [Rhodobacteraceae bacterium F11138]
MSLKANSAGALALASAAALGLGALPRFIPTTTAIGAMARILDSLAPWFLALALLCALPAALCGLRRLGAGLMIATLICGGFLIRDHVRLSLPLVPERSADLRVLFFNALGENAAWGDRIVTAILDEDPDVVTIAEPEAIYPALKRLREHFDFVSPCTFETCTLLVATRRQPLRFWRLSLNPAWENRYAVAELETASGKGFFLAASHLMKPWLVGLAEMELARLKSQYDWLPGPVIAVGDFNAASWSRPMQGLLNHTGMRTLRTPIPTWPAAFGPLGVPIDHVLVHEGARVVQARAFGEGLNSNHLGIVADIALP